MYTAARAKRGRGGRKSATDERGEETRGVCPNEEAAAGAFRSPLTWMMGQIEAKRLTPYAP